jgi:hypothetical protein
LIFYDISGDGNKLQVFCNSSIHKGKSSLEEAHKHFRRGYIIGIIGALDRTKTD